MPLMSHLAEHGWVCVADNYRLSPRADLARPHRRRQAGPRLDQGAHRRVRRRPRLRRRSPAARRAATSASLAALTPNDAELPARLRGRRHLGGGRGAVLRRLRLHEPRRHRATRSMASSSTDLCHEVARRRRPRAAGTRRRRSAAWTRTPHRSSCCTAPTTRLVPVEQARAVRGQLLRDVSTEPVAYAELPGAQHAFDVFASPRSLSRSMRSNGSSPRSTTGTSLAPPTASRETSVPQNLTPAEAAALVRDVDVVGIPLGPGHPNAFVHAMGDRESYDDLVVSGALLTDLYEVFSRPGVRLPSAGSSDRSSGCWRRRARGVVRAGRLPPLRPGAERSRRAIMSTIASPPDADGSAQPLAARRRDRTTRCHRAGADPDRLLLVEVNPQFPRTLGLAPRPPAPRARRRDRRARRERPDARSCWPTPAHRRRPRDRRARAPLHRRRLPRCRPASAASRRHRRDACWPRATAATTASTPRCSRPA